MSEVVIVRPADFARRGEQAWVIKSWLACDRASPAARRQGATYHRAKSSALEALFARSSTHTLVAHFPENSDNDLAGFACFELDDPKLHYVYVRKSAQRLGVARTLVRASGLLAVPRVTCTHQPIGLAGYQYPAGWTYSPLAHKETACASAT